jgi:hypothetical protein
MLQRKYVVPHILTVVCRAVHLGFAVYTFSLLPRLWCSHYFAWQLIFLFALHLHCSKDLVMLGIDVLFLSCYAHFHLFVSWVLSLKICFFVCFGVHIGHWNLIIMHKCTVEYCSFRLQYRQTPHIHIHSRATKRPTIRAALAHVPLRRTVRAAVVRARVTLRRTRIPVPPSVEGCNELPSEWDTQEQQVNFASSEIPRIPSSSQQCVHQTCVCNMYSACSTDKAKEKASKAWLQYKRQRMYISTVFSSIRAWFPIKNNQINA